MSRFPYALDVVCEPEGLLVMFKPDTTPEQMLEVFDWLDDIHREVGGSGLRIRGADEGGASVTREQLSG